MRGHPLTHFRAAPTGTFEGFDFWVLFCLFFYFFFSSFPNTNVACTAHALHPITARLRPGFATFDVPRRTSARLLHSTSVSSPRLSTATTASSYLISGRGRGRKQTKPYTPPMPLTTLRILSCNTPNRLRRGNSKGK